MLTFPTGVQDLLDEGRIIIRGLIRFDLGGGSYGFVKGSVPFTWAGLTYVPGAILDVSDISGGTGATARQFTITLASSADDALTPEVLRTIEDEDYRDRPVTIYDAYFHPDTGAFLGALALRRGYIDTIPHNEDENGYSLTANCETRALDYTRTNGRKRNSADQQRRAPGDKWLDHASTRGREDVNWGSATKQAASSGQVSTGNSITGSSIGHE